MLNRCIAICPAVKWVTRTYIDDIFAQQAKSRGYVASVKWCERCTKLTAIVDCIVIIIFSHYTDIYDLWMLHWSIQSDNINDKSIMQYSLLCRQLLLWKNVQTFFYFFVFGLSFFAFAFTLLYSMFNLFVIAVLHRKKLHYTVTFLWKKHGWRGSYLF